MSRITTVYWSVFSESDPRFNKSVSYDGYVVSDLFGEALAWIKFIEMETETKAPEDLEYSCVNV